MDISYDESILGRQVTVLFWGGNGKFEGFFSRGKKYQKKKGIDTFFVVSAIAIMPIVVGSYGRSSMLAESL